MFQHAGVVCSALHMRTIYNSQAFIDHYLQAFSYGPACVKSKMGGGGGKMCVLMLLHVAPISFQF